MQPYSDPSPDPGSVPPVRGFLHEPASGTPRAALVLTHGAGANCQSPLLIALAEAFSAAGLAVLRCDLPFRQQRPHGPPLRTAPLDQAGLRAAVASLRATLPDPAIRIFLGGHSYGGRMATMLAASVPDGSENPAPETAASAKAAPARPTVADALLLLSYPLHPPRKPDQLRTRHFPQLHTPALFVHGSRDPFGSIEEISAALARIPARHQLLSIDSAGHELLTKTNRATLPQQIVESFLAFVAP